MNLKAVIKGLIGCIPFLGKWVRRKGTGGTNSSRYCYSVWMRHLVHLYENGMVSIPKTIAEIGPGDSIGVGLCALLSGVGSYFAFDKIEHASLKNNLSIFDELVVLFKSKAPIPDEKEFPELKPKLKSYDFPSYILSDNLIKDNLNLERIEEIKKAIINNEASSNFFIKYIVPWDSKNKIDLNSIDLIFSQAVMEHIPDLKNTYQIIYQWLKNGGYISHQIDYKAHETHRNWYGHLTYNKLMWKIIMQGRAYIINRKPHSVHVNWIKNAGFNVVKEIKVKEAKINRKYLAKQFRNLSDDDLNTSSAYILAQKLT